VKSKRSGQDIQTEKQKPVTQKNKRMRLVRQDETKRTANGETVKYKINE
jgi:hypothetical protein